MKQLCLALIGQGRSGKDIHGAFLTSAENLWFRVGYVVEQDADRRERARAMYPGCEVLSDYTQLFGIGGIDLVVNASYSYQHYAITKDLLEHGFSVMSEKPFARDRLECETLMRTAKEHGVLLQVFQQVFLTPFYLDALAVLQSGKIGKVEQISIRYNGFSRRWDWQTLQKMMGGNAYNTGPHPIGMALGFLGFDEGVKVAYSRLAHTPLSSGDADDYVKILLEAPGKPLVDIEISSMDAYTDYTLLMQGTKGTFRSTPERFVCKYIVDGENPPRPVSDTFLHDENNQPIYCSEKLATHEESGEYHGSAFDVGVREMYKDLYFAITEGKPTRVVPEMAAKIISVIEAAHAKDVLPLSF